MPRYELVQGSSSKFWQITKSGPTVTTTYGRIGAAGRQSVKTFETPAKARAFYERQIAAKTKKGYVKRGKLSKAGKAAPVAAGDESAAAESAESAPTARNNELEAALLADPDDREAYLVYADWLQSRGNPLGELIATQIAAEDEPPRQRKVKMRATKLLTEYVTEQVAPAYPLLKQRLLSFRLGANEKGTDGIGSSRSASISWRRGFIDSIGTWCWSKAMRRQLLTLLDDPHARLLNELSLRDETVSDLQFIAHLGALQTLDLRWADLRKLSSLEPLGGLQRLASLNLKNSRVKDLGPIKQHPLRKVVLEGSAVSDLTPLTGHPTLEHIELSETPVKDVTPLLSCPRLCSVWLWGSRVPAGQAEELKRWMKGNGAEPSPGSDYDKTLSHEEINWYAD